MQVADRAGFGFSTREALPKRRSSNSSSRRRRKEILTGISSISIRAQSTICRNAFPCLVYTLSQRAWHVSHHLINIDINSKIASTPTLRDTTEDVICLSLSSGNRLQRTDHHISLADGIKRRRRLHVFNVWTKDYADGPPK